MYPTTLDTANFGGTLMGLAQQRYVKSHRNLLRPDTWDDILRFIATIKLKETTASDIFRRLNSYSKQHGLYHALKAFGQILKSIFILRVIDEPVLPMSIEKVLSGIEHGHAFTRAVSVGNPREFLQAEKEDQEMAEACKRLIKNCIICWNYLSRGRNYLRSCRKLVRRDRPNGEASTRF